MNSCSNFGASLDCLANDAKRPPPSPAEPGVGHRRAKHGRIDGRGLNRDLSAGVPECGRDVAGCQLIDARDYDGLAKAIQMTGKIIGLLQVEVADESERSHESDMISRQIEKSDLVLIHRTPLCTAAD